MNQKEIYAFAAEYLALLTDPDAAAVLTGNSFEAKCCSLGFDPKRCGALREAFPGVHFLADAASLQSVVRQVQDAGLLGSAILLKWQQLPAEAGERVLSENDRAWFTTAFAGLKDLTEPGAADTYTMILFPEFLNVKTEVEKLRVELSMLLLERDELLLVECKDIEMAYMLAVGHLEYKAYELNCAVLRLKRKIDLIQAKKNRQEPIFLPAIEKTLDLEFAEYKKKLDAQIGKINAAIERSRYGVLTEEESKELKKLYRAVVKALHPDLHPDVSEAQMRLFHHAVTAYENGDLNTLRIIRSMVSEPPLPDDNETAMSALLKEKTRLTQLLHTLHARIDEIKRSYPYTMKELVQSEEKIAEKQAELNSMIAQLKEALEIYKQRLEKMLR